MGIFKVNNVIINDEESMFGKWVYDIKCSTNNIRQGSCEDDNGIKILHADEVTPGGWFDLCHKGIENKYPGITKMINSILEES